MRILNRLERRFGSYAIKKLMVYIVAANALIFVIMYTSASSAIIGRLLLIPSLVMRGEWWRLVTYVFIPPTTSPLWVFFVLYFYYTVGIGLENEWGAFKFNVYYLIGYLGTTLAAFITGGITTSLYLNLSLFLAFAHIYPNYEILLFWIVPVRVKYLAWLNLAFLAWSFVGGGWVDRAAILASIANYLLFFGSDILLMVKTRRLAHMRRTEFMGKSERTGPIHRCAICGMTEEDDITMDFRYCTDCEGDYEYCREHLHQHEHVRRDEQ